ncbi:MAG: glycerophosphodiester phosphodiesterase [Candidatus Thorarchaeota archaeon]
MNEKKTQPLVIGHRGAYNLAPENTLKAFRKAIELEADYIEFDVHESQDGNLIVIHGVDILKRMGNDKKIDQMTLKELKKLDLGEGERIPELKAVFHLAKGKIGLICELKAKGMSEKVTNLLRNEKLLDSTIIISFDLEELIKVRKIEPELKLGAIVPANEQYIPDWKIRKTLIQEVIESEFQYITTRFQNIDKEFVDFSHKHGLKVFTYTPNTKKTIRRVVNLGVDGIFVNNISKAKAVLKE